MPYTEARKTYIRESELINYSARGPEMLMREARSNLLTKTASTEVVVFLSHSHEDKKFVEEARLLLASQGVKAYVDWEDTEMPNRTCDQTARQIQQKIKSCKKFIVLASVNAVNSRWVPWELGFADPSKTLSNIAILPVSPDTGQWKGAEYIGIYSQIFKSNGVFYIEPSTILSYGGPTTLREWLKR